MDVLIYHLTNLKQGKLIMSDLIIAVTNYYNDTVTMLPPMGELEGIGEAIFHNNPRIEFDGRDIKRNFTHHVDFNINANQLHRELLPAHYASYPRLSRQSQYIKLYQFNEQRDEDSMELLIPNFYLATKRQGEHVTITNFGLPTSDRVVIKDTLGARGSDQIVIPTNMLTSLLKYTKGLTYAQVKAKFPDIIISEGTNMEKVFFNDPGEIFISDLIPVVEKEWRLLVGGDKIYGREREIKKGVYNQANLDLDVIRTIPEVKYTLIDEMFDERLVKTLYELIEFADIPTGSLDLFVTGDGQYGLFEWSTQYAFMGANNHFIRQLLLDGIAKVIRNLNKK